MQADVTKGDVLVTYWQEKAEALCGSSNYDYKLFIVRDKGCGDAVYQDYEGFWHCEVLPASVFGVLDCHI